MPSELPEPAPWIGGLPQDERGFYVLSEAGWENGKPIFSKFSVERTVTLAVNRGCSLCGYLMPSGRNVYRAFAQGDAAHIRGYERDHAYDPSGPLHLSCILYSTIVCPYLREKTARLGKDSMVNPGARRGSLAAVMGFKNYGLMLGVNPPRGVQPLPKIGYMGLDEDIRYRDGDELRDRYAEAVLSDQTFIDINQPRMFWTDSASDKAALNRAMIEASQSVRENETVWGPIRIADGGPESAVPFVTKAV